MKILKITGGIIVAIVVIFLSIGVFVPTVSYELKITVKAPLDKSFSVFVDDSRMGEWFTGFVSYELISGEPGTVGSIHRVVIEENGKELVSTEEVIAYIENQRYAFTLDNDLESAEIDVRFSGDITGTEITIMTETTGKNIILRSLMALLKPMFVDMAQRNYTQLKEIIESTPDGAENITGK